LGRTTVASEAYNKKHTSIGKVYCLLKAGTLPVQSRVCHSEQSRAISNFLWSAAPN
jgi:hypothetical protein